MTDIDPAVLPLLRDVDLLCLDAGNTVVFLDHERLARAFAAAGAPTTAGALNAAEGATKVALDRGELEAFDWSESHAPAPRSWGRYVGTMACRAGIEGHRVTGLLEALWPQHRAQNFWRLVPEGLPAALAALRACGVAVAVVSNSG